MSFDLLNPTGLEKPTGYSHVATVRSGRIVFVAGQAPFNAEGRVVGKGDFVAQYGQVLRNLKLAVEAAGGKSQDLAVLTMYVTDAEAFRANLKAIGANYREVFGKYYPVITLVEVKGLYNSDCMVEISGIAVIDE